MSNIEKVLIDGDIILNKACFSTEGLLYDPSAGKKLPYSKGVGLARYTVDKLIESICEHVNCYDIEVYIGGPSGTKTFRHDIAVTAPYKGNRVNSRRPIEGAKVREYLISEYHAIVADGVETDDLLGINQTDNTIIASVDKDLLQVPGLHYNIDSKQITKVEDPGRLELSILSSGRKKLIGSGYKWFCAQLLLGDTIDNIIKPQRGLGDTSVYDMLKDVDTMTDMWYTVSKVYETNKRDIEENAQLLWILRSENRDEWRLV